METLLAVCGKTFLPTILKIGIQWKRARKGEEWTGTHFFPTQSQRFFIWCETKWIRIRGIAIILAIRNKLQADRALWLCPLPAMLRQFEKVCAKEVCYTMSSLLRDRNKQTQVTDKSHTSYDEDLSWAKSWMSHATRNCACNFLCCKCDA